MKRFLIMFCCGILTLSMTGCAGTASTNKAKEETAANSETEVVTIDGDSDQIANPFIECDTLTEAAKLAGLESFKAPESLEGYSDIYIDALEDSFAEITYMDDDEKVEIRKNKGTDSESGDYNTYSETVEEEIGDYTVTLEGNDGKIMLASWNDGTDSFYIYADGMDKEAMISLIEEVQ